MDSRAADNAAPIPPPLADDAAPRSLLDLVLEAAPAPTESSPADNLRTFLREPSPLKALAFWVLRSGGRLPRTKRELAQRLSRDIARIDALLGRQVNAILHHPDFQRLEASWRGLRYLVDQVPEGANVKVRVLNATWKELARDLERAIEFDQSQLFRKVYNEEFGTPGGEPFGVLLGDYAVRHKIGPDHPTDDVGTLMSISSVAAAAFAPFVAGADPGMLDLGAFSELEKPLNLARVFEQKEYLKWRAFRHTDDARFVGLVLPHVLMRLPYRDEGRVDRFRFREEVGAPDRHEYLWGNAVYAFGAVLVRAFTACGWLADIRGVRQGELDRGLVAGLPVHSFGTDSGGVAPKCSTDAIVHEYREKELAELGFIPLSHCHDTELAAFFSNQSAQRPRGYDGAAADANARISAMLQYMLCVSRFAHYLKVIGRDKIGSLAGPAEIEAVLNRWLINYITTDDSADPETKATFPLRESRVQVREHPGRPGSYHCVMHLRPHFQLDQVLTTVRLATELAPRQER
jgi:type VI secretion system ImpC/EvpB family protein